MRLFYAHSISGKHYPDERTAKEIITLLQNHGHEVLSEEFFTDLDPTMSPEDIHLKDITWLAQADLVLVNCTNPSLGVGYEIGHAESLGKTIVCFYQATLVSSISPMITGNTNFKTLGIHHLEELLPLCASSYT